MYRLINFVDESNRWIRTPFSPFLPGLIIGWLINPAARTLPLFFGTMPLVVTGGGTGTLMSREILEKGEMNSFFQLNQAIPDLGILARKESEGNTGKGKNGK